MTVSPPRAAAVALVAAGLLAACGSTEQTPASTPPQTTPKTTVSTTPPANATFTLAELVDNPCRVLSKEDAAAVGSVLDPIVDGTDQKYCMWFTTAGAVGFKPHPSADLTADPANQQRMTATQVSGRRALLGAFINNRGCVLFVAHGAGASIEVFESRDSQNPAPPGTCPLSPKFAAAIVANLR